MKHHSNEDPILSVKNLQTDFELAGGGTVQAVKGKRMSILTPVHL